ncbi:MAG: hypothetical protein WA741_21200 [Candidatus Sulfotelmatobacter sp.]
MSTAKRWPSGADVVQKQGAAGKVGEVQLEHGVDGLDAEGWLGVNLRGH